MTESKDAPLRHNKGGEAQPHLRLPRDGWAFLGPDIKPSSLGGNAISLRPAPLRPVFSLNRLGSYCHQGKQKGEASKRCTTVINQKSHAHSDAFQMHLFNKDQPFLWGAPVPGRSKS
jgi:hypothetical protein